MLIQSTHSHEDRGVDAYFSPPEATISLIAIEKGFIPHRIWEPACGDGAIVRPLQAAGYEVVASDLIDYGVEEYAPHCDYLIALRPPVDGIITNPPYKLALQFAEKAVNEVPYVALLLRTNFLEGVKRLKFFKKHPPARVWVSSRRLPMMHRHGWEGPKAPSNTCHAWFVWDENAPAKSFVDWFDWKDFTR